MKPDKPETQIPADEYYDTPQAAKYIHMSTKFLEAARHKADGSGPDYTKLGRAVRYSRIHHLDPFMLKRTHRADAPPKPNGEGRPRKKRAAPAVDAV
ncbi:MAG: hypothetical protein WCA28_07720 [Bradyrhizobium sp.]